MYIYIYIYLVNYGVRDINKDLNVCYNNYDHQNASSLQVYLGNFILYFTLC